VLLSLLLSTAINLAIPKAMQIIIDRGITLRVPRIIILGSGFIIAFSLMGALFSFIQGYLATRVSHGVAFDLRNHIYDKIQHLSFSYHDRAQTGQLLTRATSDVDLVREFIGKGVIQLLNALIMMGGSIILLYTINWKLTLMVLPVMALAFLIFFVFARIISPFIKIIQEKLGLLNTRLQESITGIRVVKAFAREVFEEKRFAECNRNLRDINLRTGKYIASGMPLIFAMANISTLVVVWAGGYQVLANYLTIGELVAFMSYLMMSMFPMMMLGMFLVTIAQATACAERIFEVLDASSETVEKPGAVALPPIQGKLIFENVTFRYFKGTEPVLSRVSFTALPGQTIALLGATGSGKSTVINLIPRFYDVSEGGITIDGYDIRDVSLESLRRQIGIVLQEVVLFGGTIRENIAYGKPEATDSEITEAARRAAAHTFIESFPQGYNTVVGERGVTLSGGQKQRIAIARALLVDPRILILDDSMSSVDFKTESKIRQALERLRRERLCFVIAQRISTVKNADQIIILDKGEVAALGNHKSLMAESPLYADIYYSELKPDDYIEKVESAG
jgi:ATP-binding cassette subfamily B protein